MRPLTSKLIKEIDTDPFYRTCCLKGLGYCNGRIEMHHNLIYSGQQQNYKFCILPLCSHHHAIEKSPECRDLLDWIMIKRTTLEFLIRVFPKRNWLQLKNYLDKKYAPKRS